MKRPPRSRRWPRTRLTAEQRRECYFWLRALGKTASEARQLRDKAPAQLTYLERLSGPVTNA